MKIGAREKLAIVSTSRASRSGDRNAGRSRWRDTETVRLHYEVSRLPGPVRAVLYDEVKVLSPSLCLGIGGINAARGRGDHFFYALVA
jgi:hypothetical protein